MTGIGTLIFLTLFLVMWGVTIFALIVACKADNSKQFFPPAAVAALAAFLFTGPFCLVVWFILLLKASTIRRYL